MFMQFGGDLPLHSSVRKKSWEFLFFFCLFCILNLNKVLVHQRFGHSNSDIVAIYRSILMQISAFLRERNALSNV